MNTPRIRMTGLPTHTGMTEVNPATLVVKPHVKIQATEVVVLAELVAWLNLLPSNKPPKEVAAMFTAKSAEVQAEQPSPEPVPCSECGRSSRARKWLSLCSNVEHHNGEG